MTRFRKQTKKSARYIKLTCRIIIRVASGLAIEEGINLRPWLSVTFMVLAWAAMEVKDWIIEEESSINEALEPAP